MPRRAPRPGRSPPPLSVHQLHELRPAVHDRSRRPLRPAGDDDGRIRDVRALPRRVRRPARPPLPRPAERMSGLRAPRLAPRRRRASPLTAGGDAVAAAAEAARQGRDRRGQGPRRLSSRVPCRRRGGGVALRSRKQREEKPLAVLVGDLAAAHELVDLGEAEEVLLTGRERPIVIARRVAGAAIAPRSRRVGRPRRDAALLAASPPARPRRRRAARDHLGQPLRRADRVPRRRCAVTPRRGRRRFSRPQPADPHPHRRLRRPRPQRRDPPAAAADPALARLRPRRDRASRSRRSRRFSAAAPSSRALSASRRGDGRGWDTTSAT